MNKRIAIVGGGISGLAAAFYAREKFGSRVDIALYERDNRLGGTIGTTREEGYLVDWGSNGFLDREPLTLEFIEQIGLKDRLYPSNEKSTKRFIYRNRKLWEIKPHPVKFMKSGLLSLTGRMRLAMEYFVGRKNDDRDESIFDFAARRIGKEAAETMIDPMVSGIYGGDAHKLSLRACFPVMAEMERDYGGLIKAMIAKQKEAKGKGIKSGGPGGPTGHLTSFRGGLYTLIERLGELLRDHVHLSTELKNLSRNPDGKFILEFPDSKEEFDIVILAVPTYCASEFTNNLDESLAGMLAEIPYSNLAVVCQGYKTANIERPLDGFGFLVPHSEGLDILGSIWTSVIYPEQAPEGYALFRTMLGGALNNEIVKKPLGEISDIAYRDLSPILGIKAKPDYEKIFVWTRAIPQYVIGHNDRVNSMERRLSEIGNIFVTGNAYNGIGLNDCIKRSYRIVSDLKIDG